MDQLSTYAKLRNNVLQFMKRHGDQVRTGDIIDSPDIGGMQIAKSHAYAYVGSLMSRLAKEGEVVRIKSYDPRHPNSKYAYRLPNEGEIVSNHFDEPIPRSRPTEPTNSIMAEKLKEAGVIPPKARDKIDGPVAKVWHYLDDQKEAIKMGGLTRTQAGAALKLMGINGNTISTQIGRWVAANKLDFIDSRRKALPKPRRSTKQMKKAILAGAKAMPAKPLPQMPKDEAVPVERVSAQAAALPRLNLMIDKNGKGVTLTLSGISIHIGIEG